MPATWMRCLGAVLATLGCLAAADPVDLRGYGRVEAKFGPQRGEFACESVEKADILLDKLQADLFWDKTLPLTTGEVKLGANRVVINTIPGYGSALIARAGSRVLVLGGADAQAVTALARKEPSLLGKDVTSAAAKPHPLYLDYFDNRAYKSNIAPMNTGVKFDTAARWEFMKSLGGGMNVMGPQFEFECPAPGVVNWTKFDFEIQEAERQHELIALGPWGGSPMPLWARNRDPANMMLPTATTVIGDWGGAFQSGINWESWSTPFEQRLQQGLGFQRAVFERYRSSPSLGAWMIFAGWSWEYTLVYPQSSIRALDASPAGQAGWRRWLKDERGWSLADLGTRWYGDPKRFSSWEDVVLPDRNVFFGDLGPDSLHLTDGWRWQNRPAAESDPIPADDAGWVPTATAPAQRIAFLNRSGFNHYDITLDPGAWLAKQAAGADAWLVFSLIGCGDGATRVWLNDELLDVPTDEASRESSFAIKVTGLLKPGANHLQVALNCAIHWFTCYGELAGPVFLTTHEPRRFPYLGRQANARYADLVDWQAQVFTDYHRQVVRMARRLDPDRPLVLSGGMDGLFDFGTQLCADFSMAQQITWRECRYSPQFAGAGLAAGYYGTSEFSNTTLGTALDQGFAWTMFDADSSHNLTHSLDEYMQFEKDTGWFTRHRRQINLFGKYLREQPKVALLNSGQSHRYGSVGWSDIGGDVLPSAHFDNVYVSGGGLKGGLAEPYPVLVDIGNQFMDAQAIAAIAAYVEKGGTFIALGNSGRHTTLEPDTFPLAALSGFKAADERRGRIRFAAQLPVFGGWENREFETRGLALAASAPDDKTVIPLARWGDGSVAIGCRKLGKGRIITLGCLLWQDGRDLGGGWKTPAELRRGFFTRLFADCGVARNADASLSEVWARKMVTKNGLQNWLLAFNSKAAARQADVWMAVDGKPDQVIDLDGNESVPFVLENGGVSIKAVSFEPYAVKAFAVRRATLAGALPNWWYEKTRYWKRTPVEVEVAGMTLPAVDQVSDEAVIPITTWRFRTDPGQAIAKQPSWATLPFDDAAWSKTEARPWNIFDPALKDYHGIGLYRARFTVPPAWKGRRVLLNLYSFTDPIVHDTGEFLVNGAPVTTYQAHGWNQTYNYDVTDLVHPGENLLALKASGGPQRCGLAVTPWIEAHRPLSPAQDLAAPWQAVAGDWLTRDAVEFPNQGVRAKYLTREIRLPAEWKGRSIQIEWSSQRQWVGSLVVNGRPINYNGYAHPYGLISRVDVTPSIRPGEVNVIELWPYKTMTWSGSTVDAEGDGLQLDRIQIGCR